MKTNEWRVCANTTTLGDTGDFHTEYWLEKEGWRNIYINSDDEDEFKRMAEKLNSLSLCQPLPKEAEEAAREYGEVTFEKMHDGKPHDIKELLVNGFLSGFTAASSHIEQEKRKAFEAAREEERKLEFEFGGVSKTSIKKKYISFDDYISKQ